MKIIFVCHGNICRSAMAEFIFRYLSDINGVSDRFEISSAGVSSEETGNDMYPPAKRMLREKKIPFSHHTAHRITDSEFNDNDLVIALDSSNMRNLQRRFGCDKKIEMLLERDVEDPWYTDDFFTAYNDIYRGCSLLLERLLSS